MNKFLIIVPTLNSYIQLTNLITSLQNKNYLHWKVIFVDGKSNEKHKDFLKNLCKNNSRFFTIEQKQHTTGIYGAMNEGLAHIKNADYIMFWGSDDYALDNDIFEKINQSIIDEKELNPKIFLFNAVYKNETNNKLIRESYFSKNN